MKLTGQCKKDFEKWYIDNIMNYKLPFEKHSYNNIGFYTLSHSMQYGVLVDFFDSVGMYIEDISINDSDFTFQIWNKESKKSIANGKEEFKRQIAREQAITKAKEIYNK